tara:strand:+ start:1420 stop:2124 length:705 start_codon:yes stop_codon:yes gene_type:complete
LKLLITTRADQTCIDWAELTHSMLRKYAERVGADFLVLDESVDCHAAVGGIGNGVYQYRIMKHYDLHAYYDRILHLDSDMVLAPNCPDLFEIVPYDSIGTIYEDVGSRKPQRLECMMNAQKKFGDIGWTEGYINTGVIVTSECHRDIYRKINGEYFVDWGTDDIHMGYLINKLGYKVKVLPYQYNHMTMFSEQWNGNPDRFDSHIIHYAGRGVFDNGVENKLAQAELDYKRLYG